MELSRLNTRWLIVLALLFGHVSGASVQESYESGWHDSALRWLAGNAQRLLAFGETILGSGRDVS